MKAKNLIPEFLNLILALIFFLLLFFSLFSCFQSFQFPLLIWFSIILFHLCDFRKRIVIFVIHFMLSNFCANVSKIGELYMLYGLLAKTKFTHLSFLGLIFLFFLSFFYSQRSHVHWFSIVNILFFVSLKFNYVYFFLFYFVFSFIQKKSSCVLFCFFYCFLSIQWFNLIFCFVILCDFFFLI